MMESTKPALQQPWEKWPDETDTAYHRFSVYLNLGPDRSLTAVRQKVGKKSGYTRQLQRWSSKYNWVERASQYDRYLIRKSLKNKEEIMDNLTAKVLNRAEGLIDELLDIAFIEGTVHVGKDTLNLYSQKLKAIESALDRIGFVKQKESIDTEEPESVNNYINNIYARIGHIMEEQPEE